MLPYAVTALISYTGTAALLPDEAPQKTGNTTQWVVFFRRNRHASPRQDRLGVCFIAFAR